MIHKVTGFTGSWATAQRKGTVTLIVNDEAGKPTGRVPIQCPTMSNFTELIRLLWLNDGNNSWDDSAKCLIIESEAG